MFLFRRRNKLRKFSQDPQVDKSLRHSVKDGVAYSVMSGAGESYFSAFAVMLKATPGQIGLLAALPQLMASIAQMLSAWLGQRYQKRKPIILIGAHIQCLSWLPMIVLPWIFPEQAVPLFLLAVMMYYFGSNMTLPQWSSLMGDLVDQRRRGRYFAYRTRLASVTSFIALLGAGMLLHLFDKSGYAFAGFASIFAIAMFARMVSIHQLKQMYDPPGQTAVLEIPNWRLWRQQFINSPFALFSMYFAFMQFATAIASPFFSVYLLRELNLSYFQFTLNMSAIILAQFLTLNWWGRIADVFGNRLVLITCGMLIPIFPLLWTTTTNIWYIMLLQALGGFVWAGFSLSAGNYVYDALPANKRVTLMAAHSTLANIGVFAGATLGGFLATHMDKTIQIGDFSYEFFSVFFILFLVSGIARAAVSAIFLPKLKEVGNYREMPVRELFYRVSRFTVVSGLFFEVIGSRRKRNIQPNSAKR
ncbi:MAG: MFS transporter [Gammaproteobacteria bacterium]|nr:MFS transporter [Gammaproteobacteria bacterium]